MEKGEEEMTKTTLYLRDDQASALKKRSEETHIVVAELIRMAIDAFLTEKKKK